MIKVWQWQGDLHLDLKVHEQFKLDLCFWMKEFSAEEFDPVLAPNFFLCKEEHVTEKKNVK